MPNTRSRAESTDTKTFSLISDEKLLAIYAGMLKCRLLQQRAAELFQHGKLESDLHASVRREATAVSVAIDLSKDDALAQAQGDWLPSFVKGLSPESIFRLLAAQHNKSALTEAASQNISFPSPEADVPELARNHASSDLAQRNGAVAVAFLPPASDSLSLWHKTIQAAGKSKLPLIFVQYGNDFAAESGIAPSNSRVSGPVTLIHGVPAIAVDALDAVAVYRVAYEAITRARQLRGATILQCITDDRTSSSLPNDESIAAEPSLEPIAAMETYLRRKKIEFDTAQKQTILQFKRELDLASRFLGQ